MRIPSQIRKLESLVYPLSMLLGFLVAVGGLVYWYWTTTPSYALTQVVVSLKNKDAESFERYVDIDAIVGHAFDDIIHGPARSNILGRMDNMIGAGIVSFFKPEIISIAHDEVVHLVEKGAVQPSGAMTAAMPVATLLPGFATAPAIASTTQPATPQVPPLDAPVSDNAATGFDEGSSNSFLKVPKGKNLGRLLREYGLSKDSFHGYEIKQQGSIAFLILQFHSPKLKRDFRIEFKLEDVGGFWRVTELSNLNELVTAYLETRPRETF